MKDKEKLISEASNAALRAYAPYSKFRVGAAVLADDGTIYTGVNVENRSYGLTICAERNAIANMITNGESRINKLVAVMRDGTVGLPCGACRELMMQLDENSGEIEILIDIETQKTIKLKELVPEWWGTKRFAD